MCSRKEVNDHNMSEIHIFSGHYGSGKTEIAVNFAAAQRKQGKDVTIIDLDTVNPYFRTSDLRNILENKGIRVIAGKFASSNTDMPILPPDVMSAFGNEGCFIFDVGGDDDGAYALGGYSDQIKKNGFEMHLVVNLKRPLTSAAPDIIDIKRGIETASRLKFTDIYNNTNLSRDTEPDTLMSLAGELVELERLSGLKVVKHCGTKNALSCIPGNDVFPIELYLRLPF